MFPRMGFFDFLGGKREQGTLDEVSRLLGGGRVAHKPNDRLWEWQGTVGPLRARVQIASSGIQGAFKPLHDHGSFVVARNLEYVKDAGDSPGDAWSQDDAVRVFVGRGTYLESFASEMPEEIAAFRNLPDGGAARLVAAMDEHALEEINAGREDITVRFPDGCSAERIAAGLRVVAAVFAAAPTAAGVAARQAASEGTGPDPAASRVKCRYCRCMFLLGSEWKCSNCGAPAEG